MPTSRLFQLSSVFINSYWANLKVNLVFTDADITIPSVHFRQSPGMASLALMLSHNNISQQHNNSRSVGGGDQFASQLRKDPSLPSRGASHWGSAHFITSHVEHKAEIPKHGCKNCNYNPRLAMIESNTYILWLFHGRSTYICILSEVQRLFVEETLSMEVVHQKRRFLRIHQLVHI